MTTIKTPSSFGGAQIGIGTQIGPWTPGQGALDRQYWSPPLSGNQIINTTVTAFMLQVREFNAGDNVDRISCTILLCNNTGGVRDVLVPHRPNYGPTLEFVNATTLRNKRVFTSGTSSASSLIATNDGDYIVVEIGHKESAGATPEAQIRWGYNTAIADCSIDETTTATQNGFLEFGQDFVFIQQIQNCGCGDD